MVAYAHLIKRCRKYRGFDLERFVVLEWRLKRRWHRELKRRGLK
jgi:hypothetical protein